MGNNWLLCGCLKGSLMMLHFLLPLHSLLICFSNTSSHTYKTRILSAWRMKVSRVYGFQRDQFMKFHRKTRLTSSVTLGSVQRRASQGSLGCFPPSCIFRQVFYKLKSRLKQALVWQRSSSPQYSYDFRSYSLNFDDGLSSDHIPPRFCWWYKVCLGYS